MVYPDAMPFADAPLDWLNLLFVPLMIITATQLRRNWASIWDNDLTSEDRYLLLRTVIFLLLPAVVLFHELGHGAATIMFGGKIREFHYGFLWGYVVPAGKFTVDQLVWTYFAGNLVQILIGIVAIAGAAFAKSPPVVALLVYFGLWTMAGTAIFYALMSFTGLYGDWLAIYTAPAPALTLSIAIFHGIIVLFILFCLYDSRAKLWFIRRTRPQWLPEQQALWARIAADPSADNWVNLGWSFYRVGLNSQAEEYLRLAQTRDGGLPEAQMLRAALAFRKGDFKAASAMLTEVAAAPAADDDLRHRALVTLASCQVRLNEKEQALQTFDQAAALNPSVADPHFFKAMILLDQGKEDAALAELMACRGLTWVDPTLELSAKARFEALTNKKSGKK